MKAANGATKRWLDDVAIPYRGDVCLLFPFPVSSHGYGHATVDGKRIRAHRYVCEAVNGPPPFYGIDACHCRKDGCACESKACCTPAHLRWDSRKGNMSDTLAHGTRNLGERNGHAKLTEGQVLAIRGTDGVALRDLADQFGVAITTIHKIKTGRKWSWLKEEHLGHMG